MNNYLQNQYIETRSKFEKFSGRLERSQERGEFQRLSPGKQRFLLNRIRRLWEKLRLLEVQLKICSAGVSLALLMMVSNVNAQDQFVLSPDKNPVPPPTIQGWSPVVADVDADGDLDLFITSFADLSVHYFKNVGTPQAPDFQKAPDIENPFRALTVQTDFQSYDAMGIGDVDGDGDMDILSYDYYNDRTYLFTNLGGNESPLFTEEEVDFTVVGTDLGDIDGDGDLDLVEVTYEGDVIIRPNVGNATNFDIDENAAEPVSIVNWENSIYFVYFTRALDVDEDGDLDLVFGAYVYDYGEQFILIAENTGTTQDPAFTLQNEMITTSLPQGNSGFENMKLGDLDGDGDFDAVVMDFGLGMIFLEQDNGLLQENTSLVQEFNDGILLPLNYYLSPQFTDLDGDGDPDLIAMNYYGNLNYVYYEFQETGQQLKYVRDDQQELARLLDPVGVEFPFYIDMDGDGDMDAVSMVYDGEGPNTEFHYFQNTGTTQAPSFQPAADNPFFSEPGYFLPSFADIDGDGDVDLFLGYPDYDGGTKTWFPVTAFFENSGGAEPTFTEKTGADNPLDLIRQAKYQSVYFIRMQFGDIDEDGDLDAIFNDFDGNIRFLHNIGSATQPSFVDKSQNSPFTNIWAGYNGVINLVDMDKDGDTDLLIHNYYRMLTEYYENTGYQGGLGITPVLSTEGLELFPNPVTSELNIQMQNGFRGTMEYEIMNVLGKQVLTGTIDKPDDSVRFTIAAADLDAGVYMIRIRDGDNRLYLSKFVKQ